LNHRERSVQATALNGTAPRRIEANEHAKVDVSARKTGREPPQNALQNSVLEQAKQDSGDTRAVIPTITNSNLPL
jgi:hypothetical protein